MRDTAPYFSYGTISRIENDKGLPPKKIFKGRRPQKGGNMKKNYRKNVTEKDIATLRSWCVVALFVVAVLALVLIPILYGVGILKEKPTASTTEPPATAETTRLPEWKHYNPNDSSNNQNFSSSVQTEPSFRILSDGLDITEAELKEINPKGTEYDEATMARLASLCAAVEAYSGTIILYEEEFPATTFTNGEKWPASIDHELEVEDQIRLTAAIQILRDDALAHFKEEANQNEHPYASACYLKVCSILGYFPFEEGTEATTPLP